MTTIHSLQQIDYLVVLRQFKISPACLTTKLPSLFSPLDSIKQKQKNLKKLAQKITEEFSGEIPETREELMSLPGVGRKTANLVLNRAFNKPAIAVDIHVHRITNMLGWVDTTDPEDTEEVLMGIIPQKYWTEMNTLFVSLGRQNRF